MIRLGFLALLLVAGSAGAAQAGAPEQAPLPMAAARPGIAAEAAAGPSGQADEDEAAAEEPGQEPRLQPPPTEARPGHEPDESESAVAPPEEGPAEADPSACEAALAELGTRFERTAPLAGEGPCGAASPVTVSAVGSVELRPAATVRCPVARALALWLGRVAAPMADVYMPSPLRAVLIGTDYQCRRRRGDDSSKFSEHAFANAVDVMGVVFEDGTTMPVQPREGSAEAERAYQAAIRGGACAFFTTVLGPATNASHDDHLHLDMAERRGGYRLCE